MSSLQLGSRSGRHSCRCNRGCYPSSCHSLFPSYEPIIKFIGRSLVFLMQRSTSWAEEEGIGAKVCSSSIAETVSTTETSFLIIGISMVVRTSGVVTSCCSLSLLKTPSDCSWGYVQSLLNDLLEAISEQLQDRKEKTHISDRDP